MNDKMNIGIISDTHDDIDSTMKSIDIFNYHETNYVFHAGDYIFPKIISLFERLNNKTKFFGVRGNNDGEIIGIMQQFKNLNNAVFLNDFGNIVINNYFVGTQLKGRSNFIKEYSLFLCKRFGGVYFMNNLYFQSVFCINFDISYQKIDSEGYIYGAEMK